MPSDSVVTNSFRRAGPGSWIIPISLLVLCLITAAAFFFATSPRVPTTSAADLDVPQPTPGGVLRLPLFSARVRTLDPARSQWASEILLMQQIYDGLTALDEHLNVVPALARYWDISPDGTTYTFELRHDAVFHNGQPVTAEDCVFSFERLLKPGLNESNYHYFSRIEGAQEFREGLSKHVSGLRALDEKTFQIQFTSPFVQALSVMSMFCSKILPKEQVLEQGEAFFKSPIGTGPFQFSRWIDRDEDPAVPLAGGVPQGLRLDANPSYFGGSPLLDAVVFRAYDNAQGTHQETPILDRFDYFPEMNDVTLPPGWTSSGRMKQLSIYYLVLPAAVPPYDDARVRRALHLALDKRRYLNAVSRTRGTAIAATIVPPGIPGFLSTEVSYQQNLLRAKELLAEAGYETGRGLPPIEIPIYPGEEYEKQRLVFEECMSSIGVEVKGVKAKRWAIIMDTDEWRDRPLVYDLGWIADFPDPDNFLRPLFHSASPMNNARYKNPEVDELLDQALSETSYSARNKLYHKIERIILRDSPIIPLYCEDFGYLIRSEVNGFSISPMGPTYLKLNRVWLAEDGTEPAVDY